MNPGGFSRVSYDKCAYKQKVKQSISPLDYQMYIGQFENRGRCIQDRMWRPFDKEIVDIESELYNITRRKTSCSCKKYRPTCKKSKRCTSTFDKSNPVVLPQYLCPIIRNNIVRPKDPMFELDTEFRCAA